ncbi:MAG: inositol monophosphatase family protein, partial [Bacteroidota bacterium]
MSIDLPQLTQSVAQLSREVGAFILQEVGRVRQEDIQEKDLNSLVSYVDQEAERRIVAGLQARLPTAAFLTEEATVAQTMAPQRWIVDPLDGTTNFLFGLPCFAVSIALEVDGELVLGVVYEPNRDECFTAWQGGGAYCNELPMRVRQSPNLAQALLSTGFP